MLPSGNMKKYSRSVIIYIDTELERWLNSKTEQGYNKSALARHILTARMRSEANAAVK